MLKVTVVVHGDGDRIKSKIKKEFAQEARNIPPGAYRVAQKFLQYL